MTWFGGVHPSYTEADRRSPALTWGADRIPRRSQRAQPGVAVPARGMVQKVQVDDQPPGSAAQVGALGGVEHVPAAAVTRLARGPVAQRQEQAAGVLLQPPHIDGRVHRRRQVHAAKLGHRDRGLAARHGQRHVPVTAKQGHVEPQSRIVGPVRHAGAAQRVAGRQRALRMGSEQLISPVSPQRVPAPRIVLVAHGRVELTNPAPPVDQLQLRLGTHPVHASDAVQAGACGQRTVHGSPARWRCRRSSVEPMPGAPCR